MELRHHPLFLASVLLMAWAMFADTAVSRAAQLPAVAERKSKQNSEFIKRFGSSTFRQSAAKLAYSPDGRWLAAGNHKTVLLFDARTGEILLKCSVYEFGMLAGLAFSPDGKLLSVLDPQGLRVFETIAGALPRRTPEKYDRKLGYLKFSATSPDRKWRATMPNNEEVGIAPWDQVEPVHRIPFKSGYPHLAMGNEGTWLATADSRSPVVKIWKAPEFKSPVEWKATSASICKLATSPDGQSVFAGGYDGSIQAWSVKEGREIFKIAGSNRTPVRTIRALALSWDGKLLAAATEEDVTIYETASGRFVHHLDLALEKPHWMICLAFSPDGNTLAVGPHEQPLQLWDVKTGKALHRTNDAAIENVFATKDRRLFGSHSEGTVSLWNRQTGELERTFPLYPWPVEQSSQEGTVIFHGTEQLILHAPGGELRYRDLAQGRGDFEPLPGRMSYNLLLSSYIGQRFFLYHQGPGAFKLNTYSDRGAFPDLKSWDLNASPSLYLHWARSRDGRVIAGAFADRSVFVWDTATAKLRHQLKLDQTSQGIFLNSDGDLLAIAFDESITVWDLKAGKQIQKYPAPKAESHPVAFGAKDKLLAVSTPDEPIRIWGLETGNEILALPTPDSRAMAMAFSPDDKSLAVGFQDKTIGLFDLDKKEEVQIFEGHSDEVTCLEFDPQGSWLASGSKAPEAFVWDVKTGKRLSSKTRLFGGIRQVQWSADGKEVVVSEELNRFIRYSALKDDSINSFGSSSRSNRPLDFAYSEATRFLAVAFHLGIRIMDGDGRERPFLRVGGVNRVEWSDDGRVLLVASNDGLFGIDVDLQKAVYRIPADKLGSQVSAMAKSPDGRIVATGHSGSKVCLWSPKTGQLIREIPLPRGSSAESLQFSADGRLISAFSRISYLIIEVESGLVWFQKPNGPDPDTSFALMGRDVLLSAEPTGTARLWSWATVPKDIERLSTEQLWEALSTTDGPTVARSMLALADGEDETVAFLADHLPGVPAPPEKVIALIKDLEDEAPAKRRKASEELRALGKQARPHLEATLKRENLSPRVRLRIRLLLSAQDSAVSPELLAGRAIQLLEWIATPKAQSLLEKWASESTGQLGREAQAALARLVPSKP